MSEIGLEIRGITGIGRQIRPLALAALCCFGLAACAETEFLVHTAKQVNGTGSSDAKLGRYKVGSPYQIKSVWYYPAEDYEYAETGIASWYGPNFHGKKTANGEIYNQNDLTAVARLRTAELSTCRAAVPSSWGSSVTEPPKSRSISSKSRADS